MNEHGWLELDGAVNVRDLGGLPTADGRRIRPHVLIRSDNLQSLSDADVRYLVDDVGVRAVADLRTGVEVSSEGPGPITAETAVRVQHLDLYPEGQARDAGSIGVLPWQTKEKPEDEEPSRRASSSYQRYLTQRPDSIVAALRLIAGTDGATIVHCAAGKDRTGVIVAMTLAEVGVPDASIVADYARSAERIDKIISSLAARATYRQEMSGGADIDRHTPRAETMQDFLDVVNESHGGVRAWLREHGWTDTDAQALRERLVA